MQTNTTAIEKGRGAGGAISSNHAIIVTFGKTFREPLNPKPLPTARVVWEPILGSIRSASDGERSWLRKKAEAALAAKDLGFRVQKLFQRIPRSSRSGHWRADCK